MTKTSGLHCPLFVPSWVPELCTHKLLKYLRLSYVHSLWSRQWQLLGCSVPCGFLPCQEVDVAVICYLHLALRVSDVGCASAISLSHVPPQNGASSWDMHYSRNKRASPSLEAPGLLANEQCREKAFGFILPVFDVLLLSTSQPPEWGFPKIDFGWEEGLKE